jgi:hypothetical protein
MQNVTVLSAHNSGATTLFTEQAASSNQPVWCIQFLSENYDTLSGEWLNKKWEAQMPNQYLSTLIKRKDQN